MLLGASPPDGFPAGPPAGASAVEDGIIGSKGGKEKDEG